MDLEGMKDQLKGPSTSTHRRKSLPLRAGGSSVHQYPDPLPHSCPYYVMNLKATLQSPPVKEKKDGRWSGSSWVVGNRVGGLQQWGLLTHSNKPITKPDSSAERSVCCTTHKWHFRQAPNSFPVRSFFIPVTKRRPTQLPLMPVLP